MTPRDYQETAITATNEAFVKHDSALCVMPTGTGKTVVFGHVIKSWLDKGRIMVIAHREELLQQASEKIYAITGIHPAVEKAEQWSDEKSMYGKAKIVVSSVQTQNTGRMNRFYPSEFSLLIIDEAHHAAAKSYRAVIDHYRQNKKLKVFGVTATPDRHDEEALGQVFETVSMDYDICSAIHDGWLVPIEQDMVHVDGLDFSSCRTTAGDLNGRDLANIMEFEQVLHGVAVPTLEICTGKTLVFCASVAHAERMSEILNRHQPNSSRWVCGTTMKDERAELMDGYRNGEFRFLCNVGVATEGFDVPDIQYVVIARPTKSRPLYAQMIGRGTRPLTGLVDPCKDAEDRRSTIKESSKPACVVLDFVGNSGKHKLITVTDILGGNYSDVVVEKAKKEAERKGKVDVAEELILAQQAIKKAAEDEQRRKRMKVKAKVNFTRCKVNPFSVIDLSPWRESGYSKHKPPSEKMTAVLDRWGVKQADKLTYSQSRQMISTLIDRRNEDKCSYKQAGIVQRFGYNPGMSFSEAKTTIDAIASNGWKRPSDPVSKTEPVVATISQSESDDCPF